MTGIRPYLKLQLREPVHLRDTGLVGFTRRCRAPLGVFAVSKKNDAERLVFDYRPANELCRPPPILTWPPPPHCVESTGLKLPCSKHLTNLLTCISEPPTLSTSSTDSDGKAFHLCSVLTRVRAREIVVSHVVLDDLVETGEDARASPGSGPGVFGFAKECRKTQW